MWLNIKGVPLHAWTPRNFNIIASKWGTIVGLEDFTETRRQIHIGRVLIHTLTQKFIHEVVNLSYGGEMFSVRVMEDLIEVINSGARYDMEEN